MPNELKMGSDDIAFALGQCLLRFHSDPAKQSEASELIEMAKKLQTYNGIHFRMLSVCDVAFSRGYFFVEERSQIREFLDEMDELPDQIEVRSSSPRVPVKYEKVTLGDGSFFHREKSCDGDVSVCRGSVGEVGADAGVQSKRETEEDSVTPDVFPPPGIFCLD